MNESVSQPNRVEALAGLGAALRHEPPGQVAGDRLQVLDLDQGREQVADVGGEVGVAVGVLGHGRTFAAAVPLDELLGQPLQWVTVGVGRGHGSQPSGGGPAPASKARNFSRART